MKAIKFSAAFYLPTLLLLFATAGCERLLEEPFYSELDTENLLRTKKGIETTLFEGYAKVANMNSNGSQHTNKREEMTTDILTHSDGGEHRNALQLIDFTWDPECCDGPAFYWNPFWQAIRDANIVLENIDRVENVDDGYKAMISAEARFVRAYSYYELWDQYGSVPLRTSTTEPLQLPSVPSEEIIAYIISEFRAIENTLPLPGDEENYGRAHRGAVRAFLTIVYLNSKQWQNAADMAKAIIDEGHYQLYPDYNEMFALENERNSEFIWVRPAATNVAGAVNIMTATAFPWGFQKGLDGGINGVTDQGWTNYASQYRLRDEFYYSFDDKDQRKYRILTKYINKQGDTIDLLKDFDNAARSMKFPPDPNATGLYHGNDIPKIRYAEILLSRAEALNELNGPNQESIELINQIRNRAGLDDLMLSDFASKDDLRDHILDERKWEFWYEAKRRRDLIRTGKFIEFAHQRGVSNAQPYHERFPLPQYAIDANPLLEQNPGY